MAVNKTEYKDIVKQIKLRQFPPIYVLMGEEPYFIDKLTGLLEESVLTEDEKFMNFSLFYGKDCRVGEVINEPWTKKESSTCWSITLQNPCPPQFWS